MNKLIQKKMNRIEMDNIFMLNLRYSGIYEFRDGHIASIDEGFNMIKNGNINIKDLVCHREFRYACENGNLNIVKKFIGYGFNIKNFLIETLYFKNTKSENKIMEYLNDLENYNIN
jgi:hypothetical protein